MVMKSQNELAASISAILALGLVTNGAAAQVNGESASGAQPTQLEEVTVTAQKRVESAQDVPIAIKSIGESQLSALRIADTMSLPALVPGLAINHTANEGNVFLRGVGTNIFGPAAEPTVATYIDGVYVPSPEANLFQLGNIQQIEVLKGPQGTLFGRNTTGGVIHVHTRMPTETPGGEVTLRYGNYQAIQASAFLNGGLGDNFAANLFASYADQGEGWGRNITTGSPTFLMAKDDYHVRGNLLWTPTDRTSVRFQANAYSQYNSAMYRVPKGGTAPDGGTYPGRYNARSNKDEDNRTDSAGGSVTIDHDFGGVRFVSISGYIDTESKYRNDQDHTPLLLLHLDFDSFSRTFSQEFQLQSPDDTRLQWVVGAFYFDSEAGYDPAIITTGSGQIRYVHQQDTQSIAGFGQATWAISDRTDLTLGARYTTEDQHFVVDEYTVFGGPNIPVNKKQDFAEPTYRVSVSHEFSDGIMGYASFNNGFKSGGFNHLAPLDPPYKPEKINAYEIGLKTELMDRQVRLNAAAFYYDYKDIQVTIPRPPTSLTGNGAAAEVLGLEVDFDWLATERLSIRGGLSLLDPTFTDYDPAPSFTENGVSTPIDASGNDLIGAPRVSGNLAVEYRIPTSFGDVLAAGNVLHVSEAYYYPDNRQENPEHTLLNASLGWTSPSSNYSIQLWGANLTDEYYLQSTAQSSLRDVERAAAPRTYGITLTARF